MSSHELGPKQREEALKQAKQVIDTYIPVFDDIARSNLSLEELNDQLGRDSFHSAAVVAFNNAYFRIVTSHLRHGQLGKRTSIILERLMPIPKSGSYYGSSIIYSFDSDASSRVITQRQLIANEAHGVATEDDMIDSAEEIQKLFKGFVDINDDGTTTEKFAVLDEKATEKVMKRHNKALKHEFGFGVNETPKQKLRGIGSTALSNVLGGGRRPRLK